MWHKKHLIIILFSFQQQQQKKTSDQNNTVLLLNIWILKKIWIETKIPHIVFLCVFTQHLNVSIRVFYSVVELVSPQAFFFIPNVDIPFQNTCAAKRGLKRLVEINSRVAVVIVGEHYQIHDLKQRRIQNFNNNNNTKKGKGKIKKGTNYKRIFFVLPNQIFSSLFFPFFVPNHF